MTVPFECFSVPPSTRPRFVPCSPQSDGVELPRRVTAFFSADYTVAVFPSAFEAGLSLGCLPDVEMMIG
jgi:hypothetical protein